MADRVPGAWVTLGPGEDVVWTGRPSPYLVKYWIGVAVGLLLVGGGVVWLLPQSVEWLGWLVVVAAVGVVAYAYLAYRATVYVITTEKVYRKRGIVRTSVDTIRLDRVQNVSFSQSVLQRLVNCGNMTIVTAGAGSAEMVLRSVPRPSSINGLIVDQLPTGGRERSAI